MTPWPRLSDSFCPKMRAMMSLPPPAANPTMIWIGRVGYFAGSSCAVAGAIAARASATNPRHMAARKYRFRFAMEIDLFVPDLKSRHVDMEHGGLAVIQRSKTAVDRGRELIRFGDAFAMRAEGAPHRGEIPLL